MLCEGEQQTEVARQYQVTQGVVSSLAKLVRDDPDYLDKVMMQRQEQLDER